MTIARWIPRSPTLFGQEWLHVLKGWRSPGRGNRCYGYELPPLLLAAIPSPM